ncbi:DUF2630 family protein [Citricoccus sp. GCM10030269]|uniref:DUF2630 family protein n=1 Tax=Citricoccus sp. GCM10030269 TaxID=3273388 RepID=UPI00361F0D61
MSDQSIHQQINDLVDQEHRLRDSLGDEENESEERQQLRDVETQLDQCWDLLRQRQAKRDAGQNPDDAQVRPAPVVENYRN